MNPSHLTTKEAANLLDVHRMTISRWIKTGALRSVTISKRKMIPWASIEGIIVSKPTKTDTK